MKTYTDKIVIMVENNMDHIELALDAFTESGVDFSLLILHSGNEVLDYLSEKTDVSNPAIAKPHAILFDIKTLGWQRCTWLERIQARNQKLQIPLVLLSSCENTDDLQLSQDIGADDFMIKPLEPVSIEAQFKKLGLM